MPIYEFRCTQCGQSFDVSRPRDKAGEPANCPHDGAVGQRLFSAAIIVGAGGGDDFDFGDMEGMGGMPPGMPDMGGMDDMDMDF